MEAKRMIRALSDYGADTTNALDRFMDDEELYTECVILFLADVNFDKLWKAIDEKDFDAAFEAAHTLKGVAANLGLTPIHTCICDTVEALRAHRYQGIENHADSLRFALTNLREVCI